ncbi:MAG: ribonuclease D [Rhodobacteraceae bacterium]|nr:ribonuclease D [Paracoccaceae bacterium]
MITITKTEDLAKFCDECASQPYVTVDTEFLRERTYYSQLCLIQMAYPGEGDENAVIVDPLANGIDLTPMYELFKNTDVVKVFHAARQDLEIFCIEGGVIPEPFFDTQIAAMVCGFGEQVGYEKLVRQIVKGSVDKSSRFTDWSRRPLTDKQKTYALADVTHLRVIYEYLDKQLKKTDRTSWVTEEEAILTDPATYRIEPQNAWKRLKTRTTSGRFLSVVRELAKFREITAQTRNIPRNRVIKDDALMELASTRPKSYEDLNRSRLLLREARKGATADGILAAVKAGEACPEDDLPTAPPVRVKKNGTESLGDLLRVLLKSKAERYHVAPKLIATANDLDAIANGDDDEVKALSGWRKGVFGDDALRLRNGEIALSATPRGVKIIEL